MLYKQKYTYALYNFSDARQKNGTERVFKYFITWNHRIMYLAGESSNDYIIQADNYVLGQFVIIVIFNQVFVIIVTQLCA